MKRLPPNKFVTRVSEQTASVSVRRSLVCRCVYSAHAQRLGPAYRQEVLAKQLADEAR